MDKEPRESPELGGRRSCSTFGVLSNTVVAYVVNLCLDYVVGLYMIYFLRAWCI